MALLLLLTIVWILAFSSLLHVLISYIHGQTIISGFLSLLHQLVQLPKLPLVSSFLILYLIILLFIRLAILILATLLSTYLLASVPYII